MNALGTAGQRPALIALLAAIFLLSVAAPALGISTESASDGGRDPIARVEIQPQFADMAIGQWTKFFATAFNDKNISIPPETLYWEWYPPQILKLDDGGGGPGMVGVQAVMAGTGDLTVRATDNVSQTSAKATARVTVNGEKLGVKVIPGMVNPKVGDHVKFSAAAYFSNGTSFAEARFAWELRGQCCTITASYESSAEVMIDSEGFSQLVAHVTNPGYLGEGSASIEVGIRPPLFGIDPLKLRIGPASEYRFATIGPPPKGEIVWKTDCPGANITQEGLFRSGGEAQCRVTAFNQDLGVGDEAGVEVTSVPPKGIGRVMVHAPLHDKLPTGLRLQFFATVIDPNGAAFLPDSLEWSTSIGEIHNHADRRSATFVSYQTGFGVVSAVASYEGQTFPESVKFEVVDGGTTTFEGTVVDKDGRPVPDIRVYAFDTTTKAIAAETRTDTSGHWILVVPRGPVYEIRVDAPSGYEQPPSKAAPSEGKAYQDMGATPIAPVPPSTAWMWGLIGIGMIATTLAVAGLVGGEFLFTAILFGAVGLIARWRKEKVLDHFVRGQIFGAIQRDPGITYSDVRRLLQVANGELAYHLHTLEREGFVKSVRDGKYRRYYALEAKVPKLTGIRISTVQQRIVDFVKQHPGCSQADVSRTHGMNLRTVNYNVQQLRRAGLVSVKVEGGRSHLYATGEEKAVTTPAPVGVPTTTRVAAPTSSPAGATFRPGGAGAAVSPSGKAVGARAAAKALAQKRAATRQIDIDRAGAPMAPGPSVTQTDQAPPGPPGSLPPT